MFSYCLCKHFQICDELRRNLRKCIVMKSYLNVCTLGRCSCVCLSSLILTKRITETGVIRTGGITYIIPSQLSNWSTNWIAELEERPWVERQVVSAKISMRSLSCMPYKFSTVYNNSWCDEQGCKSVYNIISSRTFLSFFSGQISRIKDE